MAISTEERDRPDPSDLRSGAPASATHPFGTLPSDLSEESKPPEAKTNLRMVQLDLLRGVAILLVMCFHGVIRAKSAGFLSPIASRLNCMGWSGVDLFFVLSGFLIGGLLFKEYLAEGRLDVRRFIVRRAFKIWPSYYVYLLYLAVLLHFTDLVDKAGASKSLIPNLLHIQNYTIPPRGHTWSLAVEEHFYLLLPFLLALLIGRSKGAERRLALVPWIAAVVAGVCLSLRYLESFHKPWAQVTHYFPTQLRIDSLFFGVVLAYFYHLKPALLDRLLQYRKAVFIVGLALVLPATSIEVSNKWMSIVGFSALYVGYGCILLAVIHTPVGVGTAGRFLQSLPARCIAFIGVYSYPIYLWHIDCATLPLKYLYKQGFLHELPGSVRYLVFMAIYVAVATTAGVIMGNLVEKPALKLRNRFFPSRIPS